MQLPPSGVPPQWGSSPRDPQQRVEPGYGGQPAPGSYGQPGPGYGGRSTPGGYGQPGAADYSQQPPYAGYGGPPYNHPPNQPGPGYAQAGYDQQPGYGAPGRGGYGPNSTGPSSEQLITWITLGVIGLLGLFGAILTLTLWFHVSSAVSHASDACDRFGGEYSSLCRQSIKDAVPGVPVALVIYLVLMILGCLVAVGGAVLLFLKKSAGQFLILGGGIVMLTFAIICEAQYNANGRITYDLVAGLLIAIVGGLMFVPAFRSALGLPSVSTAGRGPGQFQGGGHSPYGQPQPPQYGPPGPGGYPPQQWWSR